MHKFVARSQLGSFLMEVSIGGALIAGLGLAGASFYKQRSKHQDYLNKVRELDSFHSALSKLLQNTGHCNATFKQWAGTPQVPDTSSGGLKEIKLCESSCGEDKVAADVVPALDPLLTESNANPTDKSEWIPINITDLSKRRTHWRIRDFDMPPMNTSGKAILNIFYELYPGSPDARQIQKSIMLNFKFTPLVSGVGKFISCGSEKESSMRSVMQEMCEALNAVPAPPGTETLAVWDYEQQKCVMKSLNTCPVNTAMAGIDSNGVVKCQSLTSAVDGSEMYDSTPKNCTGGLVPSIIFDSTGKLRLVCN